MSTEKHIKRVVPEHRKPRFLSWLQSNLVKVDDAECLLLEIDPAFDIDEAIGTQLDVTGEIIGRERQVNFEPPLGISPVLNDGMYRLLQRAKISLNQWNGTLPSLWELWERLFPQYAFVMYDNQDMTLNFYIMGDTSIMERELFSRGYIAPKPMGVRIRYEFILPDVELEDTLYHAGAVVADNRKANISNKVMSQPVIAPETLISGGFVLADNRKALLANKTMEQPVIPPETLYTGGAVVLDTRCSSVTNRVNNVNCRIPCAVGYGSAFVSCKFLRIPSRI